MDLQFKISTGSSARSLAVACLTSSTSRAEPARAGQSRAKWLDIQPCSNPRNKNKWASPIRISLKRPIEGQKFYSNEMFSNLGGKRANWFCILEYWFLGCAHVLFGGTNAMVAFFKFIQCVFESLQACSDSFILFATINCLGDTLMTYIHFQAMLFGLFLETICWSLASRRSVAGTHRSNARSEW